MITKTLQHGFENHIKKGVSGTKQQITVWGDSVMRGIVLDAASGRYVRLGERSSVALVSHEIGIPIDNRARFGMTSTQEVAHMTRDLSQHTFDGIAVIGVGGNDVDYDWAAIAEDPTALHEPKTPLRQFGENIAQIIRLAREFCLTPVLLTLPPIEPQRYFDWVTRSIPKKEQVLRWLGDVGCIYRAHEMYSGEVLKRAYQLGCACIDIRLPFLATRGYADMLCQDGIHPNEAGHRLMAETCRAYARERLALA